MTGVKRSLEQEQCTYCNSALLEFMIQDDCSVVMCENQKCGYPFKEPNFERFIIEDGYSSKKTKTLTVANASLETATANSVKSAKETLSQGLVLPPMTSSSKTQKDHLYSDPEEDSKSEFNINYDELLNYFDHDLRSAAYNSPNKYNLTDIENILNSDDVFIDTDSISESIVQTPKDIIDTNLFDGLDGFLISVDNNTHAKYNPLEGGDTELDSLLGI
ncbi:hypothetical protein K501DRAFT_3321 [Backusella circina FSU 941]|nr:hypothetical protein K501DRAFT_3321 [Backusella circina FSU 941]